MIDTIVHGSLDGRKQIPHLRGSLVVENHYGSALGSGSTFSGNMEKFEYEYDYENDH